jgi:hypothetical protein
MSNNLLCYSARTTYRVLGFLLLGTVIILSILVVSWVHWPRDYVVEATFVHMPIDDEELIEWLKSHPNVYYVHCERPTPRSVRLVILCSNSNAPKVGGIFDLLKYHNISDYKITSSFRER